MRNLKRALSLALASVMLLGMMVVGTSAASINDFTDVDEINNKEAVAIATGLGIFDGYTDGSFGPEKAVTRAEAAVVIAKILHGSDVNPANLAGAGKFTDVPAWAEGYVNLVAALKIIEGRGAGIFDPNATVTTVEFTTMLLKALGYYVDAETALDGDWKLEVTSKANALGLYGDLELGMNDPLSREDVASLTFNALFAQRVAYNDYRGQYVKATDRDVVVTNGTKDELNTLAQNTFGLYVAEGIVTANGMTDEDLSKSLKSEAQTTVVFTEDTDLNKDGKFEYAEGEDYDFEVETGLDMIGHAAKVYYTIEKKAPVVFAITDQATLVATVEYDTNDTILADAANDAGFKKNSILDIDESKYIVNYDMERTLANTQVRDLDTLVVISNSGSLAVDYVIALDQYLDKIDMIDDDDEDDIDYEFISTKADELYVPVGAVAEGDYIIVTDIGNQHDVLVFETAEVVSADITKLNGSATNHSIINSIVADGETYKHSNVYSNAKESNYGGDLTLVTDFCDIAVIGTANMIMDEAGKVIGLAGEKSVPNYAYVAQYGFRHNTSGLNTNENVLTAHIYFADGTNGIYEVDTAKSDFGYTGAYVNNADELNGMKTPHKAEAGLKGLYNVKVLSNGKVDIDTIASVNVSDDIDNANDKLIKAHSTMLNNGVNIDSNMGTNNDYVLYNNNDTVYFYVTGSYHDVVNGKNVNTLKVNVITGIKNVINVTNATGTDATITVTNTAGVGMKEAFATELKSSKLQDYRAAVDTMLIQGVRAEDDAIYYYDRDYAYTAVEGGYAVTFTVYSNKTGEVSTVTYDNDGKPFESVSAAKTYADSKYNGFYTLGATELKEYFVDKTPLNYNDNVKNGTTTYVVNDIALYDEYVDNLYSQSVMIGSITEEDTVIVDLCNSGLTSITKIARAIEGNKNGQVLLSYSYNSKYETAVLFVTSYDPDFVKAPGADNNTGYKMTNLVVNKKGVVGVNLDAAHKANDKFDVTLYTWSQEQAKWAVQSTKTITDVKADKVIGDGVTGFALTNGVTYKIVVNGVEFNEFIFDNTNGNENIAPAN